MSYEPTTWKDGDLVTSAKLNKLEQGVANGGGILIVHCDYDTGVLDKTWQEIYNGGFGVIMTETPDGVLFYEPIIQIINPGNNLFIIGVISAMPGGLGISLYDTQSSNGYPVWHKPDNNNDDDDESSGGGQR